MTAVVALVLAAGEGSRMQSRVPKVLHPVAGRSMLEHAIRAVCPVCDFVVTVIGKTNERIPSEVQRIATLLDTRISCAIQESQRGTADAAVAGINHVDTLNLNPQVYVITYGDVPLLKSSTLQEIIDAHHASEATVTIVSFIADNATGYGRVVRSPDGEVQRIVEHRDATQDELLISEVNSGIYVIDAPFLKENLALISDTGNSAGEKYITDIVELAVLAGRVVTAYLVNDAAELLGCNNQHELLVVRREYNKRIINGHLTNGVRIDDPDSTWIDSTVIIEADAVILPSTFLRGDTTISAESTIGPSTTISDSFIGSRSHIIRSEVHSSWVGNDISVGPFAYIRADSEISDNAVIGTFVETKKAKIESGAKVRHLSYIGDATIGQETNIGAGTIFANYDGVNKYRTTVGAHVRIGSATVLVAPVTVGDGAYTGADTVVRTSVPAGALAISEGNKQRNIKNWVRRKRSGTESDRAAQSASDSSADALST